MNYRILTVITLQMTSIWTMPIHQDLQQMQHPQTTLKQALEEETPITTEPSQKEPQQLFMTSQLQRQLKALQQMQDPSTTSKQILKEQEPMTTEPSQKEPRQLFMTSRLQRQLQALQQMQMMQKLNTLHAPSNLFLPQPILVLFPNPPIQQNEESNVIEEPDVNSNNVKLENSNNEYVDEELESVIIEAETNDKENIPQRTVLLMPSSRISIGEIISGIPWLPFEVNVPDTIAWVWNGISGIFSMIGQRIPFRPRPQMNMIRETQGANVKMFFKQLQMKQAMMPIFVVPIQRPMFPMQI